MIKREGLIQLIHFKARELSINPKLLIAAVTILARNPMAMEKNVFKSFFKELVREATEDTERKIHSNNSKTKDEAEAALKPINEASENFANSLIYGDCQLQFLVDPGENILQLHYNVWSQVIDQQLKIKRMHGRKYIADDAIQIIKYLCPTEIEHCKNTGYFRLN